MTTPTSKEGSGKRRCPRDGEGLYEHRYEGDVLVDVCGHCAGIWLDEGELKQLQESHEKEHGDGPSKPIDFANRAEAMAEELAEGETRIGAAFREPICPVCNSNLVREEYAQSSQVLIEACPAGCGLWLDRGELRAIEKFFEEARARANSENSVLWTMREFWVSLTQKLKKRPKPEQEQGLERDAKGKRGDQETN